MVGVWGWWGLWGGGGLGGGLGLGMVGSRGWWGLGVVESRMVGVKGDRV